MPLALPTSHAMIEDIERLRGVETAVSISLQRLFDLSGRVVLLTGSARGLGFEMARLLARAGAHVIVNGRDPERLRRQHRGRPQLSSLDRLLWVWLYRIWPQVIDAMVLVKPTTVIQWHRKGFRLFWRWRSRPGRPKIGTEIRALIRRMSKANPLRGAPASTGSCSSSESMSICPRMPRSSCLPRWSIGNPVTWRPCQSEQRAPSAAGCRRRARSTNS